MSSSSELLDALGALEPLPEDFWAWPVPGWLTGAEEAALYVLGRHASGSVLEIGPWLGRSTVCIARGLAEQRESARPIFVTVELNPTTANWRFDHRGVLHFHPNVDGPSLGGTDFDDYVANIHPVVSAPGGVVGELLANLTAVGVADLVKVVAGDVHEVALGRRAYRVVFTDTMHTPDEVVRNAPRLAELLAPGGVLACHDTTPENRAALGEFFDFDAEAQVDSLFVGVAAT